MKTDGWGALALLAFWAILGASARLAADTSAAPRTAVRADGTLLVEDRPVFPIGMHTEDPRSMARIAAAGFNLVSGSGEWQAEHYAAAGRERLLILGGHYLWATFASFRGGGGMDLRPSEEAGLRNVLENGRDWSKRRPLETLTAFDHLPGVIGWRTNEEPEGKLVEYVEYAYEIFKSHNPAHIVATLSCDPRWFHAFRNSADVLIVDNYPFRGSSPSRRPVLETHEWVREGVEAMPGKAVWLMPQLIPPSYWSRNPTDELSRAELRLQCYLGLIAGAKGIVMYHQGVLGRVYGRNAQGDATDEPAAPEVMDRRWEDVTAVVGELKGLGPVVCDGRPTRELELRWLEPGSLGPGPQTVRELDLYGGKYLLVANVQDSPLRGSVFGINGGNRLGYEAKVFAGEGLAVGAGREGEPVITVPPRGAGVFRLQRRPIKAPAG